MWDVGRTAWGTLNPGVKPQPIFVLLGIQSMPTHPAQHSSVLGQQWKLSLASCHLPKRFPAARDFYRRQLCYPRPLLSLTSLNIIHKGLASLFCAFLLPCNHNSMEGGIVNIWPHGPWSPYLDQIANLCSSLAEFTQTKPLANWMCFPLPFFPFFLQCRIHGQH